MQLNRLPEGGASFIPQQHTLGCAAFISFRYFRIVAPMSPKITSLPPPRTRIPARGSGSQFECNEVGFGVHRDRLGQVHPPTEDPAGPDRPPKFSNPLAAGS